MGGAAMFTRINVGLFAIQMSAILFGLAALFFRPGDEDLDSGGTFKGFSDDRLNDNWDEAYNHDDDKCGNERCSYAIVFAVVFPACTGIMEGANLSGDLENPGYSIPVGTIAAMLTSIVFYVLLTIGYGGAFIRETLLDNDSVLQESCWWEPYIVTGVLVATSSSALGSLFGGARI
eukprot:UN23502